jgi:hypothetical protein
MIADRVSRLLEEADAIKEDVKDILAEAKGAGFDVAALRAEPSSAWTRAEVGEAHQDNFLRANSCKSVARGHFHTWLIWRVSGVFASHSARSSPMPVFRESCAAVTPPATPHLEPRAPSRQLLATRSEPTAARCVLRVTAHRAAPFSSGAGGRREEAEHE